MSVPLTINGVTYDFPTVDDTDWGYNVTAWAEAITANIFPKTGGNFFLASDLNFGPAGGVIAKGFSTYVSPASTGAIRLGYTDTIAWRNQAGNADGVLAMQDFTSIRKLTFDGRELVDTSSAQNLSNKTLINPIFSGTISVQITPNRAAVSDATGNVVASTVTNTQIGYLSTTTSNVQTQLDNKQPLDADLTAIAAINTAGYLVRTGTNAWTTYAQTSTDNSLTITSSPGVTGTTDFKIAAVAWTKLTGVPNTIAGYNITDAIKNNGNTPSISSGATGLRPAAGTVGRLFIDSTSKTLQRDNGTTWDVVGSAYVAGFPSVPNVNPTAAGDGSLAIGDGASSPSGTNAIALGKNSISGNDRSVAIGYNSVASHPDAVALGGFGTHTEYKGQIVLGNGNDRNGTQIASNSMTTLQQKTTSSAVTEMDLDMATHDRLICIDNNTYLYDCDVVARDTTNIAAKNYASWNLKFTFIKGVGAASVILSGVQKTLVGASGAAGWDVTVTADTTGGRPSIKVTGAASTNISWAAFVKTCRVSNS